MTKLFAYGLILGAISEAFESVGGAVAACIIAGVIYAASRPTVRKPVSPIRLPVRRAADADEQRLRHVEYEIAYRVVSGLR